MKRILTILLALMAIAILARLPDADAPIEHDFGPYVTEEPPVVTPVSTKAIVRVGEDIYPDPDENERVEAALVEQGYLREDVPLSYLLQDHLRTACTEYGVPYELALGVISVESNFQSSADSGPCRGLMQLHKVYFPDADTDVENIRQGVRFLGGLYQKYGDWGAALCSYKSGHDTGSRTYASKVISAARHWGWSG